MPSHGRIVGRILEKSRDRRSRVECAIVLDCAKRMVSEVAAGAATQRGGLFQLPLWSEVSSFVAAARSGPSPQAYSNDQQGKIRVHRSEGRPVGISWFRCLMDAEQE